MPDTPPSAKCPSRRTTGNAARLTASLATLIGAAPTSAYTLRVGRYRVLFEDDTVVRVVEVQEDKRDQNTR